VEKDEQIPTRVPLPEPRPLTAKERALIEFLLASPVARELRLQVETVELDTRGEKRYPARRWVVKRTLAWLQKCRAILIRYDKKASNYLGLLQLACALLWYRRLHRLREAMAT
jgi:hypothetical protein